MRLTVTIELDMDAYRAKYGPGSKHYAEYHHRRVKDGGKNQFGDTYHNVPLPAEDWEFNRNPKLVEEMIKDILEDGFYDWASEGWLKVGVATMTRSTT